MKVNMYELKRFTVTFLLLFAVTFSSVQSTKCIVDAIQPTLREIREILLQQIGVAQRAAQSYTKLVHSLTDDITALSHVAEPTRTIRESLDRFVKTTDDAAQTYITGTIASLKRAAIRVNHDCGTTNINPWFQSVIDELYLGLQIRIQQKSTPRLYKIVDEATQKAVRLAQQAVDDRNSDEDNRITLVLRDVFALLIELFTFEIEDRQRQYFTFAEQVLLTAAVNSRHI